MRPLVQEVVTALQDSRRARPPVPIAYLKAIVVQARAGTEGHLGWVAVCRRVIEIDLDLVVRTLTSGGCSLNIG